MSLTKQTLWERKLLDLSLRNNLLNTRVSKGTIQLISVSLNKLEDALSDGQGFLIQPKPADWELPDCISGIYLPKESTTQREFLEKEQAAQHLKTYQSEEQLRKSLIQLYRASRLSMEENGANTLYLAAGLLKWYEEGNTDTPRFAPLLLLPIEIIRGTSSSMFLIRSREEEVMMNITLLELLRQEYDININTLNPLPKDDNGVDVSLIFNTIREAISGQKGWEVVEQSLLGIFSFNKFIMWNDIHNNSEKLRRNPIVDSLISGTVKINTEVTETDSDDLDEQFSKEEIVLPISADSSQMIAISESLKGKSFVLHGPPGTGKSQTITNIIANQLYRGKRVLFVAEKMAALQVVQHRLESIGLAPFCLELHSNKAKKSGVLEQLQRTTEVTRKQSNEAYKIQLEKIKKLRKELSGYITSIHKTYPAGISLYDCIARYTHFDEELPAYDLGTDKMSVYTAKEIDDTETCLADYQTLASACKREGAFPLLGVNATNFSTQLRDDAATQIAQLQELISTYNQSQEILNTILGHNSEQKSKVQFDAYRNIIQLLFDSKCLPCELLMEASSAMLDDLQNAIDHGKRKEQLLETLSHSVNEQFLEVDPTPMLNNWTQAQEKWFLQKQIQENKILKEIAAYALPDIKIGKEEIPPLLTTLLEARKEIKCLEEPSLTYKPLLGSLWDNGEKNWDNLQSACDTIKALFENFAAIISSPEEITLLKKNISTATANGLDIFRQCYGKQMQQYLEDSAQLTAQCEKIDNLLVTNLCGSNATDWISALQTILCRWSQNLDQLHDWTIYNLKKKVLLATDAKVFIAPVESGKLETDKLADSFQKSFYKTYLNYILSQETALNLFHKISFEEKIHRYKELCAQFEQLTRDEIVTKLSASLPTLQQEAAQSSEVGILQRNIRNGGRGTSIRKLFDQIPGLLQRMCPCMLMSPISVAQYIDAEHEPFDLVIFDEASQMPTCEAVGAIARGKNLIVVGDPKQMPPTNFFSTNTFDEENADLEDLESILDDCLALSIPSKYLQWHYRSKHESLIAFSNVNYYGSRLMTFPSPDDLANKVNFQYVEGTYDRGGTRQNKEEALAVIEEIKQRLSASESPRRSIGVVTFNTNQQSLIEDLLMKMYAENPELEHIAMESDEPIFVKNLENVQGDERDIILFSVGFGPDKEGKIALNFGPLNRDGGWRRLNVAVSRARYEMKVFSTLKADDIDCSKTSADGVLGLKAFLQYAEKGREILNATTPQTSQSSNPQGAQSTDYFVETLASKLKTRGYDIHTHIGCSGYKVDIAVVDPNDSNRYILGIQCDGSCNSAKTTRDREITQPSVLHALGWSLYHIWTLDWWESPEKCFETLCATIDAAINGTEPPEPQNPEDVEPKESELCAKESPQAEEPTISDTSDSHIESFQLPYTIAELPVKKIDTKSHSETMMRLLFIIDTEAPIEKSLLYSRIANSYGMSKMTSDFELLLDNLMLDIDCFCTMEGENCFYWSKQLPPQDYVHFRPESDRQPQEIAPEEYANAMYQVLDNQGSLPKEALIKETSKVFHFPRLTPRVSEAIQRGFDKALEYKLLTLQDDKVVKC